jgi:hypothetical protein
VTLSHLVIIAIWTVFYVRQTVKSLTYFPYLSIRSWSLQLSRGAAAAQTFATRLRAIVLQRCKFQTEQLRSATGIVDLVYELYSILILRSALLEMSPRTLKQRQLSGPKILANILPSLRVAHFTPKLSRSTNSHICDHLPPNHLDYPSYSQYTTAIMPGVTVRDVDVRRSSPSTNLP